MYTLVFSSLLCQVFSKNNYNFLGISIAELAFLFLLILFFVFLVTDYDDEKNIISDINISNYNTFNSCIWGW